MMLIHLREAALRCKMLLCQHDVNEARFSFYQEIITLSYYICFYSIYSSTIKIYTAGCIFMHVFPPLNCLELHFLDLQNVFGNFIQYVIMLKYENWYFQREIWLPTEAGLLFIQMRLQTGINDLKPACQFKSQVHISYGFQIC